MFRFLRAQGVIAVLSIGATAPVAPRARSLLATLRAIAMAGVIVLGGSVSHGGMPHASAQTVIAIQDQSAAPPTTPTSSTETRAGEASERSNRILMSRELSPWSMFLSADSIVKAVMIGLLLASIATWTVFFAKLIELARARRQVADALAAIREAATVEQARALLQGDGSIVSAMMAEAAQEERLSLGLIDGTGIKDRTESRLGELLRAESWRIRGGLGVLATVGATAPFIGLFGTVWGIMNSFIGISKSQTTNLAVVAPGIAEALLATAMGLIAAIPAVIFYNHVSRRIKTHLEQVGRAADATRRLLSRDLDRVRSPSLAQAAE